MLDADTIINYMGKMSPIVAGLDRRISFVDGNDKSFCDKIGAGIGSETSGSMSVTVTPTVLATVLVLLFTLRDN